MIVAGMAVEAWITLGVVALATVAMARERLGPDLVMFSALSVLILAGVLEPAAALAGFARPETATIAVLFVCAAAIQETGALHLVSRLIFGRTRQPTVALFRLVVPTAFMSAFMNNTPIVAMFVPMVRSYARQIGLAPSRFLIPLSYAAMFGGTCTLIGTSANLVVSGLLEQSGQAHMGMLEIAKIGLPSTVVGIAYLLTLGRRLLPDRSHPIESAAASRREYLVELEVAPDSPLVGRSIEDAGLRSLPGLFVVAIRRADGSVVRPVAPHDRVQRGDHLVLTGIASTVEDVARQFPGLHPVGAPDLDEAHGLFEVVISHRSPLVGMTVRDAEFRRRYDAAILAVHRAGVRLEQKIGDIELRAGDTLILTASPGFRRAWQDDAAFYLVSELLTEPPQRYRKAHLAMATLGCVMIVPALTEVPMLVSALGGLLLLLATGCVTARTARNALNWPVLVLIGSAFGVSAAMERSGAAAAFASALVGLTEPLGPRATLAGVYLLGVLFASFISNAAAAALLFPVAMTAAEGGGHDPRPFALALAMAASAGFSTPIGCKPNLLVYGPGGYRYGDFTRVGLPLNVLFLVLAVVLIPWIWPF